MQYSSLYHRYRQPSVIAACVCVLVLLAMAFNEVINVECRTESVLTYFPQLNDPSELCSVLQLPL